MPPENFKMKKFENFEVLSYNIYIKVKCEGKLSRRVPSLMTYYIVNYASLISSFLDGTSAGLKSGRLDGEKYCSVTFVLTSKSSTVIKERRAKQ